MITLSATCLAIALADKAGTLALSEHPSRFGDTYIAISDEVGLIEVALTWGEANARVSTIRERVA
jgi:hypothetical protein